MEGIAGSACMTEGPEWDQVSHFNIHSSPTIQNPPLTACAPFRALPVNAIWNSSGLGFTAFQFDQVVPLRRKQFITDQFLDRLIEVIVGQGLLILADAVLFSSLKDHQGGRFSKKCCGTFDRICETAPGSGTGVGLISQFSDKRAKRSRAGLVIRANAFKGTIPGARGKFFDRLGVSFDGGKFSAQQFIASLGSVPAV